MNVKIICKYCKMVLEISDIPDYQINDLEYHMQNCKEFQKFKKKQK